MHLMATYWEFLSDWALMTSEKVPSPFLDISRYSVKTIGQYTLIHGHGHELIISQQAERWDTRTMHAHDLTRVQRCICDKGPQSQRA
jgi:hypothetical protein